MADVFISYKREERGDVERIAERLRGLGLDVWFDTKLPSGQSFDEEINREVRAAKCVLVCWSPGAMASDWVRAEASIGRGRNVLAAVMLKPTDLYPPFNLIHAEDLTEWTGEDLHAGWLNTLLRIGELTERPDIVQRAKRYGAVSAAREATAPKARKQGGAGGLIAVLALVALIAAAGGAYFTFGGGRLSSTAAVAPDGGAQIAAESEPAGPPAPGPIEATAPPVAVEPSPVAPGFRVIEASVRADPATHSGPCPKAFAFSGRISVAGGAGVVSYRWLRSDGASAPVQTVRFEGPGSQDVRTEWTLGADGAHWQAIEILDPAPLKSNEAGITLTCQAAPGGGILRPLRPDLAERPSVLAQALDCGRAARELPLSDALKSRLCEGAAVSTEPVACYRRLAAGGVNWGGGTAWQPTNAVSLCTGANDAAERIGCFEAQLRAGRQWPAAIETCRGVERKR